MLGNQRVIFWMPSFCASTIQQAIAIDGLISTVGPRTGRSQTLQEYLWKYAPRDFVKHVMQSALPWPEAMEHSFQNMSANEFERSLMQLRAYGADMEQISRRAGAATRLRITSVFAATGQRSAKLCGGPLVIERAGQWFAREGRSGQETPIADGVLRIDRILTQRHERKNYIRGRIIYQRRVVRFCEPQEQVEKEGLHWMRNLLVRRGLGFLVYNPAYQRRLFDIAVLFQQPVIADAVGAVGWNERGRSFVLPKFAVGSDGKVGRPENAVLKPHPPARCLQAPEDLTPEELDRGAVND